MTVEEWEMGNRTGRAGQVKST